MGDDGAEMGGLDEAEALRLLRGLSPAEKAEAVERLRALTAGRRPQAERAEP